MLKQIMLPLLPVLILPAAIPTATVAIPTATATTTPTNRH